MKNLFPNYFLFARLYLEKRQKIFFIGSLSVSGLHRYTLKGAHSGIFVTRGSFTHFEREKVANTLLRFLVGSLVIEVVNRNPLACSCSFNQDHRGVTGGSG